MTGSTTFRRNSPGQALLRGLLALCDADDRIRWLVIGCSLARGAGDRLSDLDMAMGIRDEDFDAARPGLHSGPSPWACRSRSTD